ncbi:MAG: hypothetical protein MHMPM18_002271 [Marteilia pararefringens]
MMSDVLHPTDSPEVISISKSETLSTLINQNLNDYNKNDEETKNSLRLLGQVAIRYGETSEDRKQRLFKEIRRIRQEQSPVITLNHQTDALGKQTGKSSANNPSGDKYYSRGSDELLQLRRKLALYSIPKSQKRLSDELELQKNKRVTVASHNKCTKSNIESSVLISSNICDQKILSHVQLDDSGEHIVISSSSGKVYLHETNRLEIPIKIFNSNQLAKCTCSSFSPEFNSKSFASKLDLVTCYSNSTIALWHKEETKPLCLIKDNCGRIRRAAFHPIGSQILGFCCANSSWRLLDTEKQIELLNQDGHSREVLCLKFHPDGSLLFSGSADTYGRVWDLRSGHSVMLLADHIEAIVDIDCSPNGYRFATAGADNVVNCYDLRMKKLFSTLPAHSSNISCVKFEKNYGNFLLTSSYDNTIKIWSFPSCLPIKTLAGHSDKISYFDVSNKCETIYSVSFDRTYKRFSNDTLNLGTEAV